MFAKRMLVSGALLLAACGGRPATPVPQAPPIVARAEWGAADPVLPMVAHQPSRLTIHHTGVRSNRSLSLEQKLRGLQAFSQRDDKLANGKAKPAWADVPYHYYIDITGRIGEGRDVRYTGDTNTTYDPTGHVLVVVEGNFERQAPAPEQLAALRSMVQWLSARWQIPAKRIAAHRDFAQTSCPGDSLYSRMTELRALSR
ncbi:MAG: peptidoglycan recognition protein family protein [Gemmatimonadota bacterium]